MAKNREKNRGRVVVLGLALACGLGVWFSGCGTEVGNGHTGGRGDGEETAAKDPAKKGSAAPAPVNDAAGPAEGAVPMPEASVMSAMSADAVMPLLNECRSFFAQDLVSPFKLRMKAEAGAASAQIGVAKENGLWQLTPGTSLMWKIEPKADLQVVLKDAADKDLNPGYSCSGYQEAFNVSVEGVEEPMTRHSVTLTAAADLVTLKWYVRPSVEPATAALRLMRVEVVRTDVAKSFIWEVVKE